MENENYREDQYDPAADRAERPARIILLPLLIGLIAGIVGSQIPDLLYGRNVSLFSRSSDSSVPAAERVRDVIQEDEAVINLVEESSPAVVSIAVFREVAQAQDPLSGFFFPFGVPQQTPTEPGTGERRQIGSGSGFFVSSDGMVVTNKHVVADPNAEYTVIVAGGEEYPARVLARHPTNDIAVLKVEGGDFPALPLGDSDQIKVGQTAIAIGNPLGEFANSVSRGIVSGVQREVTAGSAFGEEERLSNIIQTDAAINPGNSGGPLFNISGEVIGVNVAVAQGAENIGFALPINEVRESVEQVRESGRITIPYIGVRYVLVNDQLQKEMSLAVDHGALVLRGEAITDVAVIPGSPADKAGIRENDIILEVNGKKITEEDPLAELINEHRVGEEITLRVWSGGETRDLRLRLEERPE